MEISKVSDQRNYSSRCANITYRRNLPTTSIIIPSHNEHWSVLLRALYSMLNRTPDELLKEIIIVDDGSTEGNYFIFIMLMGFFMLSGKELVNSDLKIFHFLAQMKIQLDEYLSRNLPKVRVLHIPPPRKGLMFARMLGARNATGEVLVFLDSNLETNVNWLPPLLGKALSVSH